MLRPCGRKEHSLINKLRKGRKKKKTVSGPERAKRRAVQDMTGELEYQLGFLVVSH